MKQRGLTFLELVLVCTLMAGLLLLATPVYQQYLLRTHRAQAAGELIAMAACQEQIRASTGAYNTSVCAQGGTLQAYSMSYGPDAPLAEGQVFLITAEPLGSQAHDSCGSLMLDHAGTRSVSNESATVSTCWAGR